MSTIIRTREDTIKVLDGISGGTDRRTFLKWAGLSVAVLAAAGCSSNTVSTTTSGVDLGSGDTGILNYAYALEQLEAAFYTQVVANMFTGATTAEQAMLADIRDHEVAHREFFKTALGSSAIAALEVNFTAINFSDRTSVLTTAKTFEDLGVSAYNGAGKLLVKADYLLAAGKIVSVEARHASAIRDLLMPKTAYFAGDDVIDANGLDKANTPATVLAAAGPYVKTTINASNLPTS